VPGTSSRQARAAAYLAVLELLLSSIGQYRNSHLRRLGTIERSIAGVQRQSSFGFYRRPVQPTRSRWADGLSPAVCVPAGQSGSSTLSTPRSGASLPSRHVGRLVRYSGATIGGDRLVARPGRVLGSFGPRQPASPAQSTAKAPATLPAVWCWLSACRWQRGGRGTPPCIGQLADKLQELPASAGRRPGSRRRRSPDQRQQLRTTARWCPTPSAADCSS
jgi:hypothetical protein